MPSADSLYRIPTPRMTSAGKRAVIGAAAILMLAGAAQAVTLTVVNQTIINGGITASNSGNPKPIWVVGGAGSGIDYGSTQRSGIFTSTEGPAGTGSFGSFLSTKDKTSQDPLPPTGNTVEQGHNTGSNVQTQGEVVYGTNTDEIQLSTVGIVQFEAGGAGAGVSAGSGLTDPDIVAGSYMALAYDMNVKNNIAQPHVTIQQLQVFVSPVAITAQYETGPLAPGFNLGTKIWDLDANGTNNSITVHNNNAGSGVFDMQIYIPISDISTQAPGVNGDWFVYVWIETETYSETNDNDIGYLSGAPDAYYPPPGGSIPEPGSLSLIGIGGLLFCLRRRRKQAA